jgi:hypothetical protein
VADHDAPSDVGCRSPVPVAAQLTRCRRRNLQLFPLIDCLPLKSITLITSWRKSRQRNPPCLPGDHAAQVMAS